MERVALSNSLRDDEDYASPISGLEYEGRSNLRVRVAGTGGGRSLLFNTHLDVVPASQGQPYPFDPRVRGRARVRTRRLRRQRTGGDDLYRPAGREAVGAEAARRCAGAPGGGRRGGRQRHAGHGAARRARRRLHCDGAHRTAHSLFRARRGLVPGDLHRPARATADAPAIR